MAHLRTGGAVTPISCSATGSTRSINRRPIRLPISASDLQHSSLLHGKQDCPGKTKPSSEPLQLSPSPVAKQWERVPEGRVRALCRSGGKTVDLSHGDHRSQAPRSSPPVAPEPDTCRSTALVGTPRERRLQNYKFARQCPIGPFTVDFLCRGARLDVDGATHSQDQETAHDR